MYRKGYKSHKFRGQPEKGKKQEEDPQLSDLGLVSLPWLPLLCCRVIALLCCCRAVAVVLLR